MINSRLNKMYIAFAESIMSDFCGNNGRYGDNGIPFSTLSPHSTKFHASFRASIFCVFFRNANQRHTESCTYALLFYHLSKGA